MKIINNLELVLPQPTTNTSSGKQLINQPGDKQIIKLELNYTSTLNW